VRDVLSSLAVKHFVHQQALANKLDNFLDYCYKTNNFIATVDIVCKSAIKIIIRIFNISVGSNTTVHLAMTTN